MEGPSSTLSNEFSLFLLFDVCFKTQEFLLSTKIRLEGSESV